jgi:HPr kinase/phosphorylase
MNELSINFLLKTFGQHLGLRLLAGQYGQERTINNSDINRPSLALTGFVDVFSYDTVQLFGNHELEYLRSLPKERRRQALEIIYQFDLPCVIVTGKGRMPRELKELANQANIPLIRSDFNTAQFSHLLHFYLDDLLAPQVTLHGTLVDVDGVGLLFTGRSAIGKSEVGLDLIERGHRLVADDTVIITRKSQGILVGESPIVLKEHMEIRGIGIINVKRLFGIRSIRRQKRVEVMVQLAEWDQNLEYERTGLEDKAHTILGVEIPEVSVPLLPGKNITVISETIALNYLLRLEGYHAAREFNNSLIEQMQNEQRVPPPQ